MDARTVELVAAAPNRRATSCARSWLGLVLPIPSTSLLRHRRQIIAHVPCTDMYSWRSSLEVL
jgi:hypothetical protein